MKTHKSRQAQAREFSPEAREEIWIRDKGKCIFCEMGYHKEDTDAFGRAILQIMHYIPRSHNGLGIPENGALGCQCHHEMMDNGNRGRRKEMLGLFRNYLIGHYKDWDESKLTYDKWKAFEKESQ